MQVNMKKNLICHKKLVTKGLNTTLPKKKGWGQMEKISRTYSYQKRKKGQSLSLAYLSSISAIFPSHISRFFKRLSLIYTFNQKSIEISSVDRFLRMKHTKSKTQCITILTSSRNFFSSTSLSSLACSLSNFGFWLMACSTALEIPCSVSCSIFSSRDSKYWIKADGVSTTNKDFTILNCLQNMFCFNKPLEHQEH